MTSLEGTGATFGVSAPPPEKGAHRLAHAAMATVFEVHCVHAEARYIAQAAEAAFGLVDALELELSRFIPNSDISRINHLAAGESARVSPSTMECLTIARHLYDLTNGAFDPSVGSGLEGLELEPDGLCVHARTSGIRLDLGGIGKGYAVDRVADLLQEWEIHRALVHGGYSSVVALDAPPGQDGWPLTLSAPGGGPILERVSARFMALGASGVQKTGHILDPQTHRPVTDRTAAWVALSADAGRRGEGRHPAAVADALSTAFMILREEEITDLCARHVGLSAWFVPEPTGGSGEQGCVRRAGQGAGPDREQASEPGAGCSGHRARPRALEPSPSPRGSQTEG